MYASFLLTVPFGWYAAHASCGDAVATVQRSANVETFLQALTRAGVRAVGIFEHDPNVLFDTGAAVALFKNETGAGEASVGGFLTEELATALKSEGLRQTLIELREARVLQTVIADHPERRYQHPRIYWFYFSTGLGLRVAL